MNKVNHDITEILKDIDLMREHLKFYGYINTYQFENLSDDEIKAKFNSLGLGKASDLEKLGVRLA